MDAAGADYQGGRPREGPLATDQSAVDRILDQLASIPGVSARKMFGEYALYLDEKVIALICDNRLFMKVTAPGLAFVPEAEGIPPYPGARNYLPVSQEGISDAEWLARFARATADALPAPKPKRAPARRPPRI